MAGPPKKLPTIIPEWPRGLKCDLAASYVGISEALLRRESAAGRAPPAVKMAPGRIVWLREDLDRWLDLARDGKPWAPNPAAFDWT